MSVPTESRYILFHLSFFKAGGVWEDIEFNKMFQNFLGGIYSLKESAPNPNWKLGPPHRKTAITNTWSRFLLELDSKTQELQKSLSWKPVAANSHFSSISV